MGGVSFLRSWLWTLAEEVQNQLWTMPHVVATGHFLVLGQAHAGTLHEAGSALMSLIAYAQILDDVH